MGENRALTSVPGNEYLETIYRPDCEYIDGEILERNGAEHDHSRLQTLLSCYLGIREQELVIHVLVEQRVRVCKTGLTIT